MDSILDNTNSVLALLSDKCKMELDLLHVLETSGLNESEIETNLRNMHTALTAIGENSPWGAIVAGTGLVKEEAGLAGEDGQEAISLLKHSLRIQQCGRGRGKAIIVLRTIPVTQDELEAYIEDNQKAILPVAVAEVAKNGTDQDMKTEVIQAFSSFLDSVVDAVSSTQDSAEVVKKALADKDQLIEELQEKLQHNVLANWG